MGQSSSWPRTEWTSTPSTYQRYQTSTFNG